MSVTTRQILTDASTKKRIQLFISCKNLADKDAITKSDPYVEIYANDGLVTSTEHIPDDLNPSFKPVELEYQFGRTQNLKIVVKDDDLREDSSEHLGEASGGVKRRKLMKIIK